MSQFPESGVDVVESFSPAPLTGLSFREVWDTWDKKVLVWGAIPSIIAGIILVKKEQTA